MQEFLHNFAQLPPWKIYGTVTMLLAQGFVLTIFPEEILILALGVLWGQEKVSFIGSFIAVIVGLLPSNCAGVFLADRFGMKLFEKRPLCWVLKKEDVLRSLRYLERNPFRVIFITRFTPLVRGPIYISAGLSGMGLRKFIRYDLIAGCVQVPVLLVLGRWLGLKAEGVAEALQNLGTYALAALVLTLLARALWKPATS